MTVALPSSGAGIRLNEDLSKGMVDPFRSLPIDRSAYLTGRILADTVHTMGNVLLLAGGGGAAGAALCGRPGAALAGFLLATAFGVAMAWVAALIGRAARNPEMLNSVGFIWLPPLTFASSAFVSVATMPGWLQAFADVNPITVTVDAMRRPGPGRPDGHAGDSGGRLDRRDHRCSGCSRCGCTGASSEVIDPSPSPGQVDRARATAWSAERAAPRPRPSPRRASPRIRQVAASMRSTRVAGFARHSSRRPLGRPMWATTRAAPRELRWEGRTPTRRNRRRMCTSEWEPSTGSRRRG